MKDISSKAKLLYHLRENKGEPLSGTKLAKDIGVSRVAVWKTVQSLIEAGYSIETRETGYLLDPKKEKDFLYPWEFREKENLFYHFKNTPSTMDRARESALKGAKNGSVFTAEKQSAGRTQRAYMGFTSGWFVFFDTRKTFSFCGGLYINFFNNADCCCKYNYIGMRKNSLSSLA